MVIFYHHIKLCYNFIVFWNHRIMNPLFSGFYCCCWEKIISLIDLFYVIYCPAPVTFKICFSLSELLSFSCLCSVDEVTNSVAIQRLGSTQFFQILQFSAGSCTESSQRQAEKSLPYIKVLSFVNTETHLKVA